MKQYLFVIVGIITIVVLLAAGGGQISNPGGGGGAVSSVFGRTGAVTALAADYSSFFPTSIYCGLTGTCSNTANVGAKIVRGVTTGATGWASIPTPTPHKEYTVVLSGISSFSDTSYECSFHSHNNIGTLVNFALNKVTGSQFLIEVNDDTANLTFPAPPSTSADLTVGYICTGN